MRDAHSSGAIAKSGVTRAGLVCAALLLVTACAVDNRILTTDGASGASPAGGGSGGEPIDTGAAGESPVPVCDYAAKAVEAGCETLVDNPGFTINVASWVAEPVGVMEGWQAEDANADPTSGSIAVINSNYSDEDAAKAGTAGGGARQCIALNGGSVVDYAADVFIPKDQGAGYMGSTFTSVATLSLFFYTDPGCAGQNASNFTSEPVQTVDKWQHVESSVRLPRGAQSMAVRLATLKPFRQFAFQAQFDNVFVRER